MSSITHFLASWTPETNYYQALSSALRAWASCGDRFLLVAALAEHRWRAAAWAFASVHMHLFCDILGSRGTSVEDNWPIIYFDPLSDRLVIAWSVQWPLVGWQNTLLTAVLIVITMALAIRHGYSPVGLFSRKADRAFVETLRWRWRRIRGER